MVLGRAEPIPQLSQRHLGPAAVTSGENDEVGGVGRDLAHCPQEERRVLVVDKAMVEGEARRDDVAERHLLIRFP
jgi:hypothetical protein